MHGLLTSGSNNPINEMKNAAPEPGAEVQYIPVPRGDYIGVEKKKADGKAPERNVKKTELFYQELNYRINKAQFYVWPPNPARDVPVPAGYTYLAQFAAHDLTRNSITEADCHKNQNPANQRHRPLLLDSLYGGPNDHCRPWLLAHDTEGKPLAKGKPPIRFALATVAGNSRGKDNIPNRSPARDIGRGKASKVGDERPTAAGLCPWKLDGKSLGVPLVADPRNDDQPMISQLTAMFQIAHNLIVDQQEALAPPQDETDRKNIFETARTALTYCYREIIQYDLLRRLLDHRVYSYYATNSTVLDQSSDKAHISRDFAHAAYRIGHSMIRGSYQFQDQNSHNLGSAMNLTSRHCTGDKVPLGADWIVDWSHFFELNGEPLRARPINVNFQPILHKLVGRGTSRRRGAAASIVHSDLCRGAVSGIRKINTIIEQIISAMPDLPIVSSGEISKIRAKTLMNLWLERPGVFPANKLPKWMLKELRENPPPFLYYLIEASATSRGSRVGPVASVIMADTFFRALRNVPITADDSQHRPEATAAKVFNHNIPRNMPALISWVNSHLGAEEKKLGSRQIPLISGP